MPCSRATARQSSALAACASTSFNTTWKAPDAEPLTFQEGDKILAMAAESIRSSLRGSDIAARYGGDEFVVLMAGSDSSSSAALDRLDLATRQSKGDRHGTGHPVGADGKMLPENPGFNRLPKGGQGLLRLTQLNGFVEQAGLQFEAAF